MDIIHDLRDDLYILTITLVMECGGEPYEGILAVANVLCTRAKKVKGSVFDAIFKAWQISAWNTDSGTRMMLDTIPIGTFTLCYKAACAAYFELSPDPSRGATHYLNEEVTRRQRGGTLPSWFDESKVTVRIAHHTFLIVD